MIILGIGSSIAPKEYYLKEAIKNLEANEKISVRKISNIYITKAWGGVAQNTFLNQCIDIETTLSSVELLSVIKKIEKRLGRVRKKHWDDRTIDIDILIYNDIKINTEDLTIPHPYITKRNFVLKPMLDICEDIIINGKKLSQWLSDINEGIKIYINKEGKNV